MNVPWLTITIFLPMLGAILIAALPSLRDKSIKRMAAAFSFLSLAIAIFVFATFDSAAGVNFAEKILWIPQINVQYFVGLDGLNLPMFMLTALLGFLAVLISWNVKLRPREYFAWLLVLETSLLGVFSSLDLFLFFLFWEIEIIPMYFLISIWGSGRKEYSSIKYVIYTLFGSALMLAGILTLYFTAGTFDMIALRDSAAKGLLAAVVPIIPLAATFFLLFLGFAVKLPMFPLHTWLPDAHTDAPTAVSVILAGLLIKMGGYGMIRVCVSIFPEVARQHASLLVALGVVGVLYGAAVTLRQTDLKRLIAYSSVSHMGYVLVGIFALTPLSLTGATLQMFSHGVVTGLLFVCCGLVYDKTHVRHIPDLGGLARQMPFIVVVFSIAGLASLGLPGTSGFAAEFLTFLGCFSSTVVPGIRVYTLVGVVGVVVTAGYILWMLRKVFYEPPKERYDGVADATLLEGVATSILIVVIMLIGICPWILTNIISRGIPALPW